jgi:cyclic-di-GMP phosphodiesterase TipF (flagellum assembly factor)
MLRLGAIFIAICMVLISASLGVVLYLIAGLSGSEATIVALSALAGLAIYGAVTGRLRDRTDLGAQIADLSRGSADLARQVAELGRRITAQEGQGDRIADAAAEKARVLSEPISAELGELSTLVKQLAETVAMHELKLVGIKQVEAGEAARRPEPVRVAPVQVRRDEPDTAAKAAAEARATMIETVRQAIDGNRVDLYLQPIVTLPQRKVRYYEGFTRLRSEDGTLLTPGEFLDAAEAGGLLPKIDHLLLNRSIQVVRRLQLKNREVGLFCNIASATLNDAQIFPQILQYMDANRAILEFKQSTMRAMGPMETESLAALRELGFRFCIDHVTDLRIEPRELGERGIRYVKVPGALLLSQANAQGTDIHAADLSDLLGRFGISLIAERIETETQVVDLLEYDVRFGQGFLFSPPRPVRAEALGGGEVPATTREMPERERVLAGGPAGLAL